MLGGKSENSEVETSSEEAVKPVRRECEQLDPLGRQQKKKREFERKMRRKESENSCMGVRKGPRGHRRRRRMERRRQKTRNMKKKGERARVSLRH